MSPRREHGRAPTAFAVLLLCIHAGLLFYALRHNYVVIDEFAHVPAGLSHWQTGTFYAYRVNPPLPRMLAALPVLAAHPVTDHTQLNEKVGPRCEWPLGHAFQKANADRYFDLFSLARLTVVAWSLLGGWLIFIWGRDLYGPAAGLFGLALWCFEPTVMAFSQVVVPDIPAAVAALAASYLFWHYLQRPTIAKATVTGLLLGVAQLTKFTNILLYPVWAILWLIDRRRLRASAEPTPFPLHAVWVVALSLFVLNAGYAFHRTGQPLGSFGFISRFLAGEPRHGAPAFDHGETGNRFADSWLGNVPVPVPADYLMGMDVQKRDFESGFRSYLAGEIRHGGWWYYYFYALAVKVPLALWLLIAWNLAWSFTAAAPTDRWKETTLWLPVIALLAAACTQTGFCHHMRYVLPAFPFAILSTSKLGTLLARGPWRARLPLVGLLVWLVSSSLIVYPHSMSYFNEAAGGPARGADHLLDSNIDWGQDLLYLRNWLKDHPEAKPLNLAYYGLTDPRLVGIEFELPPVGPSGLFQNDPAYARKHGPHPGWFAVSVNLSRGLDYQIPDGHGGLKRAELRALEYFRRFRPVARAGYSIDIYHITPGEANAIRRELGLPPLP